MKYVIFQNQKSKLKHVVIFSDHTTHSTVKIVENTELKPISAGFFSFDKNGVNVFGNSESLNLEPNYDDDGRYILATLSNMGIYAFL